MQPASGTERAFGLALRELRKRKNISQEELGFQADFDRTYISLIERGIQSPTVRTVVRLAGILQIRPSVIIRQMERILAAESHDLSKPGRNSDRQRG
ncbi:MAG: helix-turn-helix domain-containing protein [Acidobacteriia bacterium]|nr:helix-turn-helix domain-containing protein [Terriglobia bacterium]